MPSFLDTAIGTNAVQDRLSAIDRKAVRLEQMCGKFDRVIAIEMQKFSACQAFFVKMTSAVAMLAHILVDVAVAFVIAEFAYDLLLAKTGQMAVNTAFSLLGTAVDSQAKLLGGKLLIGVAGEVGDQLLPASRVINTFFQCFCFPS